MIVLAPQPNFRRLGFTDRLKDMIVLLDLAPRDRALGLAECIASVRGICEQHELMARAEYACGMHSFVIDPDRYALDQGPFSFVTWTARA